MTILTFPTLTRAPTSSRWGLSARSQSFVSPFTGAEQTISMPTQRWVADVEFGALDHADWRNLAQFLAQLNGRAGRFTFAPTWCAPRTTIAYGTPLVNGAGQTGTSLVTDGWALSTAVAYKGDYIGFTASSRNYLHQLTADVTSNGSGQATLSIIPPLRDSPADNAALNLATPSAVFMLADDDQGQMGFDAQRPGSSGGWRAAVSLSIVEALV